MWVAGTSRSAPDQSCCLVSFAGSCQVWAGRGGCSGSSPKLPETPPKAASDRLLLQAGLPPTQAPCTSTASAAPCPSTTIPRNITSPQDRQKWGRTPIFPLRELRRSRAPSVHTPQIMGSYPWCDHRWSVGPSASHFTHPCHIRMITLTHFCKKNLASNE